MTKYRLLIALALGLLIAGCATNSGKKLDTLETKVSTLEEKVASIEQKQTTVEEQTSQTTVQPEQTPAVESITATKPLTNKDIQTALKNAGFYTGPIDGKLGKRTKKAIKEFQKTNGLKADGVVGKKTKALLLKYLPQ